MLNNKNYLHDVYPHTTVTPNLKINSYIHFAAARQYIGLIRKSTGNKIQQFTTRISQLCEMLGITFRGRPNLLNVLFELKYILVTIYE